MIKNKKDCPLRLKILIANRSEIAARLVWGILAAGHLPVVVYTAEEQSEPYLYEAFAAYQLPKTGVNAYLDSEGILAIAQQAQVNAIHPGYGFLSESAEFATAVVAAGFSWIGPSPTIISLMGNKKNARQIALENKVPVLPSCEVGIDESAESVLNLVVSQIGFPLVIKDPLSGGGKGTIVVGDESLFAKSWKQAQRYVEHTFKSPQVIIEKYLTKARHIEVQVAGDGKNVIHLFERDCSTQRRYQKIIEEAPAMFIGDTCREKLYAVAVKLALAVEYDSVGTVEFLVDEAENCYFLEMNTRLQVEHAVTEMITGIDLVRLQLDLAFNKVLSYCQQDVTQQGFGLECRLYAEDSYQKFLPSTGTIQACGFPRAPFIRIDHTLYSGKVIGHYFDPMLAKIITRGTTRQEAIAKMFYALQQTTLVGVTTNQDFLIKILQSEQFIQGDYGISTFSQPELIAQLQAKSVESEIEEQKIALIAGCLTKMKSEKQPLAGYNADHNKENDGGGRSSWKRSLWKKQSLL